MRLHTLALLVVLGGCATFPDAHLVTRRTRLAVLRPDTACGPVAFRRAALGARWGEYLKVTVSAPDEVSGEARLFVDRRPGAALRFSTAAWAMVQPTPEGAPALSWAAWTDVPTPLVTSAQQAVVVDAAWPNEDVEVASALAAGAPLELSILGLSSATGRCDGVTFTVEQGKLEPSISEAAWVAELERRAGPELLARRAAEAQRADDARRAHWAAWEARREAARATLAERTRVAVALRAQHYAEWERRREARLEAKAEASVDAVAMVDDEGEGAGGAVNNHVVTGVAGGGAVAATISEGASCSVEPGAACGGSCGGPSWPGPVASPSVASCVAPSLPGPVVAAGGGSGGGVSALATGAAWLPWPGDAWRAVIATSEARGGGQSTIGGSVAAGAALDLGGAVVTSRSVDVGSSRAQGGGCGLAANAALDLGGAGASVDVGGALATSQAIDVEVRSGAVAAEVAVGSAGGAWSSGETEARVQAPATCPGGLACAASNATVDAAWVEPWPTSAAVSSEVEGWVLPSCLQRVAVRTTTETVAPSPPPVAPPATVSVEAQACLDPLWGFVSAVVSGLVQAAPLPPPPAPVHRAAPARPR